MGQNKLVRKLNRELRTSYKEKNIEPTHKYCSVCNELKELNEFCKSNDKTKIFNVESKCKICNRTRGLLYANEHKEERKEYSYKYHLENKETVNKKRKEYKQNNKELVKTQNKQSYEKTKNNRNRYIKNRIQTDENFRIRKNLSTRLRSVMRENKTKSSTEYGIDWDIILKHLGPCPGTPKKNYHIDHIVPCKYFDFTNPTHPAVCFHPSNLRWCLGDENLKKGDDLIPELITQHNLQWILDFLNISISP